MSGMSCSAIRTLGASVLMLGLAGCGGWGNVKNAYLIPDDPGMYAVEGKHLQRLDGDREWEKSTWTVRSTLSPDARFVIYYPALQKIGGGLDAAIRLQRVAWVRSEVTRNGGIRPATGPKWSTTGLKSLRVPVDYRPVDDRTDLVELVPLSPLQPGLYALTFHGPGMTVRARLGVEWPKVNKAAYSAKTCVDRYPGATPRYRSCNRQSVGASGGLQVHLVAPETTSEYGSRKMVIEGVVVNNSGTRRRVPSMEASLLGADGHVIKRWQFSPTTAALGPGQSMPFRTSVQNPPENTQKVRVQFTASQ